MNNDYTEGFCPKKTTENRKQPVNPATIIACFPDSLDGYRDDGLDDILGKYYCNND